MEYHILSDNQSKVSVDIKQSYDAYRITRKHALGYAGQMRWQKSGGHEYLYLRTQFRPKEISKSYGIRSPKTEAIFKAFVEGKAAALEREKSQSNAVAELASMAKAIGIARAPSIVTALLRKLDDKGLLGKNLVIVGTNAMYAYESAAGVQFPSHNLATGDMGILWDSRTSLRMALSPEIDAEGVLGIIKSVDKSFESLIKGEYRAVNKHGYYVDLIKPVASPPWKADEPDSIGTKELDLNASAIDELKWLVSSPKFSATIIGQDGFPAPIVCPDPRAFALYKLWLSEQASREPEKRQRDLNQALALAEVVSNQLPHLPFKEEDLRAFPLPIAQRAASQFKFGL